MLLVLSHGAGAPSSSPWMRRYAALLRELGRVVAFDYPYMSRGARLPDPLPKLIEHHRKVLSRAAKSGRAVVVGKSMGGRVGCHVAAEDPSHVSACVCLGYPLVSAARAGKPRKMRDEVLRALRTPVLFVQGTRDPLCPLDELARVRRRMTARNELYVVEDGDHGLEVTKTQLRASGQTQADVERAVLRAIADFLDDQDS